MNVGLSDFIIYNELHARVCAAAAVSLTQLLAFSQNDMTALDTNAIYDGYLNPNKVVPNDSGLLCWDLGFGICVLHNNEKLLVQQFCLPVKDGGQRLTTVCTVARVLCAN